MADETKSATLEIVRVKLADLKPHPRNPRTHPEPGSVEWDALKKSLERDYFDPLVINSGKSDESLRNVIVSGHLRTKVLLAEGYTHADAVIKDYDSERHLQVLLRANNQTGEWDEKMLASLLGEIPESEIALTGFPEMEISRLLLAVTIPDANKPINEQSMAETKTECPQCGFKW